MKLLDNIMARLRYEPNEKLRYVEDCRQTHIDAQNLLVKEQPLYLIYEHLGYECYIVYSLCVVRNWVCKTPIKSFRFGDDKEYAKLCAEELCEKLNERY